MYDTQPTSMLGTGQNLPRKYGAMCSPAEYSFADIDLEIAWNVMLQHCKS